MNVLERKSRLWNEMYVTIQRTFLALNEAVLDRGKNIFKPS